MLNRIIRIAAVACTLLIWTGCVRTLGPAELDGEIRFTAGSPLLREDATKAGPINGETFADGTQLAVWGWHNATHQVLTFGTTTKVTKTDGVWDYSPHQFWNWYETDYYDFLGVYPGNISGITPPSGSPLTAYVNYDALSASQEDIMAAGYRRTDKTITTVPLQFEHLLSAVSVQVKNAAGSVDGHGDPLSLTVKSIHFTNIITRARLMAKFNGSTVDAGIGSTATSMDVLGPAIPEGGTTVSPGNETGINWDLMIPQTFTTSEGLDAPAIIIVYNVEGGDDINLWLPLKNIKKSDSDDYITEWRRAVKYSYLIEIRLGAGILVHVKTTDWEPVDAETPGLII